MKRLGILLLLLALVGAGYYYYNHLRNSPAAAILQAGKALKERDLANFERFVDVESLTTGLADDVVSHSSLLGNLVPGGGLVLRSGLGLLKPQLAKAAHKEVQRYVETGSLEAARAAAPKRLVNISLLGLAGHLVSPGSTFKSVKYSTDKGNEALVGLEFTRPRSDSTLVVEVMLQKQADGHWQAKRITNTPRLLEQAVRLRTQQLLP